MLSILHISDLHRDPENPIGNQALLDSLENDLRRYTMEETPKVSYPNLIIVSGDIIHGVQPEVLDSESLLLPIRTIIAAARQSDAHSKQVAIALVHRLGARDHIEFRDIL